MDLKLVLRGAVRALNEVGMQAEYLEGIGDPEEGHAGDVTIVETPAVVVWARGDAVLSGVKAGGRVSAIGDLSILPNEDGWLFTPEGMSALVAREVLRRTAATVLPTT
jgi:hypothetical protein